MVYLRPGDPVFGVPGASDARVYVLGPPRDKKLLRKDLPSKRHPEVYELADIGSAAMGFLAYPLAVGNLR
jgi:hypothetical protein